MDSSHDSHYHAFSGDDANEPLDAAFVSGLPTSIRRSESAITFATLQSPPSSSSIVVDECAKLLKEQPAEAVYRAAAIYIYDGLGLRAIHHGLSPRSLDIYMFRQRSSWYLLMRALCLLQLCLVFIEPPSSFSWGVSDRVSAIIEMLILIAFVFDTYLSYVALTRSGFIKSKFRQLKCFCLVICIIDSLWTIITNDRTVRISRMLRAYFLVERSGRLRRVLKSLLRAAPVIGNVLFLLALHVLCFGFVGWMLFSHLERQDPSDQDCRPTAAITGPDEYNTEKCYFQDLTMAFISLFILLTNANFPDIMMPSYRANRFAVFYFIVFLLIGMYLLLQLVLAVIFHTFKNHTMRDVNYYAQRADRAFRSAFYLLGQVEARTHLIHANSWFHVMRNIRPSIKEQQARAIFDSAKEVASFSDAQRLSDSDPDSIDYQQFKQICQLVHIQFREAENEAEVSKMDRISRPEHDDAALLNSRTNEGLLPLPVRESVEETKRDEANESSLRFRHQNQLPNNDVELTLSSSGTILDEVASSSDDEEPKPTDADRDEAIAIAQFEPPRFLAPITNFVSRHIQGILTRRAVDVAVDVLCLLNVICVVVQAELVHIASEGQTVNEGDKDTVTALTAFTTIIFALFFVEMVCKLYIMRDSYFRGAFRCVDFYLLCLSFVGQALWFGQTMIIPSFYLRPLRMLRLARVLKRLKALIVTVIAMLPALIPLLILQMLVFYIFAIIGIALFADKITPETVPKWTALDYALNNYYANNFNDMTHAIVTLFLLMIGNNWYYVMDAAVYVTTPYAQIYFILFYSLSVLVVMNVLTAFVLEAFLKQQQHEENIRSRFGMRKLATRVRQYLENEDPVSPQTKDDVALVNSARAGGVSASTAPTCYAALRRISWSKLGQVAELKAPKGMAAVLLKMYSLSTQEGGAD